MSTVTDAEVEAGWRAYWDCDSKNGYDKIRAALEAAEAVRVKGEKPDLVSNPDGSATYRGITFAPLPEGFIPWHGGECPVANITVVEIYQAHRFAPRKLRAVQCLDLWDGDGSKPTDIIAYRIHKPADFRLEAGKYYITASGERVGPMRSHRLNGLFVVAGFEDSKRHRRWDRNGRVAPAWDIAKHDILALSSNQENSHD